MKFLQLPSLLLALSGAYVGESADVECRDKKEGNVCQERVQVNASTAISGLIDDVPKEVYEAFVVASTECLQCVDEANVQMLSGGSGDSGSSCLVCKNCGEDNERWTNCWSCCGFCRCQGCDWNQGPGPGRSHLRVCDDCCVDPNSVAVTYSGAASSHVAEVESVEAVDFNINVCMDDVNPLDPSATSYVDHTQMLADFEKELEACYADTDSFMSSWSSLCADSGIDLSLMAKHGDDGTSRTIMFGSNGVDSESAVVTTYSSDDSHRSTSHMIFYSALGFVTVSAFAVVGTAVVVKVLNKRRAAKEEQEAQWVSEMASVENTANPLSGSGSSESSP